MHYLRDLTVLILGLGDSGLAMALERAVGHRCAWLIPVNSRLRPPHWRRMCLRPPCITDWKWPCSMA